MQLTDDEIALIRSSFDRLREKMAAHDPFGQVFYAKLFARYPDAKRLFRDDLAEQGMRFLTTLGVIVESLDSPDSAEVTLGALAEGHVAYGVPPQAYAAMGDALRDTMAEWLGARFDAATDAAWAKAYAQVSGRMMAGAPAPDA